jgi:lipopolysaccharide transport system permease protein
MSYSNYQSRKVPGFVRYVADLIRFRHLCWNLVGSDLRARFRRSKLGILWAVIQPLSFALLIAWAWGAIFQNQGYWEYAVYVFAGVIVWEYITNTINVSMDALTSSAGFLRQARVPFLIFQARIPLSGFVVLMAGMVGLLVFVGALQKFPAPSLHLLLIAAYPFLLVAIFMPLAIVFSFLGAKFRDLRHIVQIALQAVFFVSPIMIDRTAFMSDRLSVLQFANPMVPLLDMLRGPLLEGRMWTNQEIMIVSLWGAGFWALAVIVGARAGRKIVYAL